MKIAQDSACPAGYYVTDEFWLAMDYNGEVHRLCGDKHKDRGQQTLRAPPASKCVARLPVWNH